MATPKGAPPLRRLSDSEVLALVKAGRYRVCATTGRVFGRGGKELSPFAKKDHPNRWYIRVQYNGGRRGISRGRLVWMVGAGCVVPAGWDVHHRDENRSADNFDNLICLHKLDHK